MYVPKQFLIYLKIKKDEEKIKAVIKQAKIIEKKVIEPKIKALKKAVIKKLDLKNSKKK